MKKLFVIAVLVLACVSLAPFCHANTYYITGPYYDSSGIQHGFIVTSTAEGVLSYETFDVADADQSNLGASFPYSINASGVVCGTYRQVTTERLRGFVRAADGAITTFDVAGSTGNNGTQAIAINASGVIVGYWQDSSQVYHGFIRAADGTITSFDAPGAGTGSNEGTVLYGWQAINASGQIVGNILGGSDNIFIRNTDGTFVTFLTPGLTDYNQVAIDDSGVVAGTYEDVTFPYPGHAFVYSSGVLTAFDPPGSTNTFVFTIGIDNAGTISGFFADASDIGHGFLRSSGGSFTIFTPSGSEYGGFAAIASDGTVAGDSFNDLEYTAYPYIRYTDGTIDVYSIPSCAALFIPMGTGDNQGTAEPFSIVYVPAALALLCPLANTGQVSVPYSSSLTASGGTPPYRFSIIGGSLPPDLTLNGSTGLISGTPTMAGTYPYTAQVTDSLSNTATANCQIVISIIGRPHIFAMT
jgi:predicted membrane protein